MISFRGRGGGQSAEAVSGPSEEERHRAAVVLERFDFDHAVFREETVSDDQLGAESLPETVSVWVDQMRDLVARQAGAKEILAALDDSMLDRKIDADRYIDDRLARGETREEVRTDVQAAHDALEDRIYEVTFPQAKPKNP